MVDVGFEPQTNARLGELERALRETIDKLEVTEKEVIRLGSVGQQLTNQVDMKLKEIEAAITKVQLVELDTRARMDEVVGHAKKEFDDLKDRIDATDNALAGTVARAERNLDTLDRKTAELNLRELEGKEELRKVKAATDGGIEHLQRVSANIIEKVVELERAITVAKQDPGTLNGVIERIEEMTKKMEEQEKKLKESEEKGRNKNYDRPILEMKAVLDIGILGDEKGQFTKWARDMANTLDNVRPGLGAMLEWLGKLKVGKEELLENEWEDECRHRGMTDECKLEWEKMDRDIWAVMNKKTDGAAKRKVESVERGKGIKAYYIVAK